MISSEHVIGDFKAVLDSAEDNSLNIGFRHILEIIRMEKVVQSSDITLTVIKNIHKEDIKDIKFLLVSNRTLTLFVIIPVRKKYQAKIKKKLIIKISGKFAEIKELSMSGFKKELLKLNKSFNYIEDNGFEILYFENLGELISFEEVYTGSFSIDSDIGDDYDSIKNNLKRCTRGELISMISEDIYE